MILCTEKPVMSAPKKPYKSLGILMFVFLIIIHYLLKQSLSVYFKSEKTAVKQQHTESATGL